MDTSNKLRQDATWWSSTPDGYGGDKFAAPVALTCRWEETAVAFTSALDHRELISTAIVYTAQDVAVGDYLFLGISIATDPTAVTGAHKIHRFDKVPDLRSLNTLRRAVL